MRAIFCLLVLGGALLGARGTVAAAAPPPIGHVFVIVLENEDAASAFGATSPAPYLASTLPSEGVELSGYYGIGHESLDNYIAMISGQAPNPETQADCQVFADVLPGLAAADGQVIGDGCVYPASVPTLAGQLTAARRTWKGYMQDMGADPSREPATCAHPTLDSADKTQKATATDEYAARHNPFVYFHSIIDDQPYCDAHDVGLSQLPGDLASAQTTPSLSFITPDLCEDGHDAPCADGRPGGLTSADAFLRTWVPQITASPAFRDGLLLITFDESETDSTACCGEPTDPNTPLPGASPPGPGGGRIGAVVLSPFVAPGTVSTVPYNHYSLLRSLEDIWGLAHLGYAAQPGLAPFGADVYSRPSGATTVADPAPSDPGTPAAGVTSGALSACRTVKLTGLPRHVRRGTLLASVTLTRAAGRRIVVLRVGHASVVSLRYGAQRRVLHLAPCRRYRVTLPRGSRGVVRVAAVELAHSERRTL
jgi:phosphatidylinositol-3-phosphatase